MRFKDARVDSGLSGEPEHLLQVISQLELLCLLSLVYFVSLYIYTYKYTYQALMENIGYEVDLAWLRTYATIYVSLRWLRPAQASLRRPGALCGRGQLSAWTPRLAGARRGRLMSSIGHLRKETSTKSEKNLGRTCTRFHFGDYFAS